MEHGACGNRLGSRFGMNSAPFLTVRALRKSQLAVTEIINDNPHLKTLPIPPEDAFLVHLLTRDCLAHGLYVDNKSAAPDLFPAGVTALYDLTRDPIADMHCPTRCLSSYLPRTALQEIADDVGERRVRALEFRHGRAYDDPVMWSLGQAMLPALAKPDQVNTIFVDHIALAFRAHIARAYGGMQSTHPRVRGGGLAPWQERRAKYILCNNLNGDVPLGQVARECALSASHFTLAFRQSLGMAPHQWLLSIRVEHAKEQLLNSEGIAGEYRDRLRVRRSKSLHQGVHETYRLESRGMAPPSCDGPDSVSVGLPIGRRPPMAESFDYRSRERA